MATPTIFTPTKPDPVQLGTSASTLLTAGASGALLTMLVLVNDTTTSVTATLYYVPSGGTAGDDNIICKDINVPSDGMPINLLDILHLAQFPMEASGTIQGLASAANQVTVQIGGWDFA